MNKIYLLSLVLPIVAGAALFSNNLEMRIGGSHTNMPPLVTAVMHTNGPVLELGCGLFSTPVLHEICSSQGRLLVTADTDAEWLTKFQDLATDLHQFVYVPTYEDNFYQNPKLHLWKSVGNDRDWAVVFINPLPEERHHEDVIRLRHKAQVIIVDTEKYGYEQVIATFPYSYTYTQYETTVTLISDFIDVAKWFST